MILIFEALVMLTCCPSQLFRNIDTPTVMSSNPNLRRKYFRPLIEYFGDSSCAGISTETSEENQQCNDQYRGVTMAGNFTLVLPYLSYSSWSTAQIYEAFMG